MVGGRRCDFAAGGSCNHSAGWRLNTCRWHHAAAAWRLRWGTRDESCRGRSWGAQTYLGMGMLPRHHIAFSLGSSYSRCLLIRLFSFTPPTASSSPAGWPVGLCVQSVAASLRLPQRAQNKNKFNCLFCFKFSRVLLFEGAEI